MRLEIDNGERGIWQGMLRRCIPGLCGSEYWGDQGVTVCERWKASFDAFLEDVGPRPSLQHSLDRYPDPYGNYEPGNARWATRQQQRENQRARATPPERARRQVASALWAWMYQWRYSDGRLAAAIREKAGRPVSARQVSRWKKGQGFPSKIEHVRAIEYLSGGEVTFQKMIEAAEQLKAKASAAKKAAYADTLENDLAKLPAERAFI